MLGISVGAPEILIVVLVLVLLFGSTQIPKLARSVGRAQKEFKDGLAEGYQDDEEDESSKKNKGKS